MNKFTKVILIISGVLLVLGIICCLVGWITGARYRDIPSAMARAGVNCSGFDLISFTVGDDISLKDSLGEAIELDKSMDLSMDIGAAEVIVKKSDNGKFFVEAEGIKTAWNVDGDKIVVQTGRQHFFWWNRNKPGKITVYVPQDYEFNDVEIYCGAGVIQMEDIKSESMALDIGAGEIIVKELAAKDLDIECGAGSVEVAGSVTGNCEIECSMGQVNLEVEQEEDYYNYEINCSMGEVNVNSSSYSGMGVEKEIDNNSDFEMSVECSMGEINITTK